MSLTYKIWCVTEAKWEYEELPLTDPQPTVCPTDPAHDINSVLVAWENLSLYIKSKKGSGEISGLNEKVALADEDVFLIEDSENNSQKCKVQRKAIRPEDIEVTATVVTTETSPALVPMAQMTITPAPGTYRVYFSTSWKNSLNVATSNLAIFSGDVKITSSNRIMTGTTTTGVTSTAKVSVDGSQAIEIRWSTSDGTITAYERSLIITR